MRRCASTVFVADDTPRAFCVVELRTAAVAGVVVDDVHDMGLLDKDVAIDALLDLQRTGANGSRLKRGDE